MNNIFILIIAICLAVNLYPTIKVVKATEQRNILKACQIFAIWCIPFLGGLAISLMYMIRAIHSSGPYDIGLTDHNDGGGDSG